MDRKGPMNASFKASAGMDVRWAGLEYTVAGTRALDKVSGRAATGRLLALMGASGAGKTTLLNALAHRVTLDSGTVSFGPYAWSKAMRRRVAFVEQDDVVYPELTVRQALTFLAELRLGLGPEETTERVDEVLALLRLSGVGDSPVGDALARGISGGERKRLCIAQELLVEPSVLLLDEPTSGLDSAMAKVTVEALREIARNRGITVICSIHQPSSQIFHGFDDLYLMHRGRAVYSGPVAGAAEYFAGPLGLPCPKGWNPADHLIDCCVTDAVEEVARQRRIRSDVDAPPPPPPAASDSRGAPGRQATIVEGTAERYALSWSAQARVLLRRDWAIKRASLWDWQQLYLHVGNAIIGGALWWRLGYAEEDIFSRFTASFAIMLPWLFFPLLDALFLVATSEVALRKELSVGAYRLSAWYAAKSTVGLAPYGIWPVLHVTITYWVTAANDAFPAYASVMCLVWLFCAEFQSLSLLLSAAVPAGRVMTVALLILTFMFLFTGVFVPLEQTPLPWLGLVNPVLYALQAVASVVFLLGDRTYACGQPTAFPDFCAPGGSGRIPASAALRAYGVWASPAISVGVSAAFLVVLRVGAYGFLRRRMRGPAPGGSCLARCARAPRGNEAAPEAAAGRAEAPAGHKALRGGARRSEAEADPYAVTIGPGDETPRPRRESGADRV